MKPVVLMVGADKGGVGKTTVTRTVLDYLAAKNALVRAFDAEHPRGTLQRFHPTSPKWSTSRPPRTR
jgi:MinD-like ATPase involved in chromosome partitioning or flagellar assembly